MKSSIFALLAAVVLTVSALTTGPALGVGVEAEGHASGATVLESRHDFETTRERLIRAIEGKGMRVFAQIDHRAAAAREGLEMQPATVIVYGAPRAGTPLMRKDPVLALQLPLKLLVTEIDGQVQVAFIPAERLRASSAAITPEAVQTLARAEALIRSALQEL